METAIELCERWKAEEDAAVEENARLQVSYGLMQYGRPSRGKRGGVVDVFHSRVIPVFGVFLFSASVSRWYRLDASPSSSTHLSVP